MKLCFGTLMNTLLLCGVARLTKTKMLNAVVKSVDSECNLSDSAVTWLTQCTANLPDSRSNSRGDVITKAEAADPHKVAEYFAKKVVTLIDPNKRKLAVLAIRDIIEKDGTIMDGVAVEFVNRTTKKALREQSQFALSEFLAGVFLYTTTVDNRVGKDVADEINEEYVNSFAPLQETIAFIVPRGEKEILDEGVKAFNIYLVKAKDKYSAAKTFLYHDQPKPFYDFYIPNGIEHAVGRERRNAITNVTAESLTNVSNFLILNGIGGLGKSMMMRHLLLDAIENFKTFRRIPIFISLKDYEGGGLLDFIFAKAADLSEGLNKEAFALSLRDGSFLLLFDGMDEIDAARNDVFERELESFTDKYPKNRYVISSRPYQNFISFSRFTVLQIMPFTQNQAIQLVKKLEFRPEEPAIKTRFLQRLEYGHGSLFETHRSFAENPLLLTIMLLMFEKFADIPTKIHIFYKKAFITLAETHDANKAFRRAFRTGLFSEGLADYFAEFCFQTYNDEKFEFTEDEFERYFNKLRVNKSGKVRAADFAHDLCANLCLMYQEGGKYHFTHRSFQEYFCAVFFSNQKEAFIAKLGEYFEKRAMRMRGDQTFRMLCDMVPDKVESNIFIPYLQNLFDICDANDGYWTFLEEMYPHMYYATGDVPDFPIISPLSYLYGYIIKTLKFKFTLTDEHFPEDDSLLVDEYCYVDTEYGEHDLMKLSDIESRCPWLEELPDVDGSMYEFDVERVRSRPNAYKELLEVLDNDEFVYKAEYLAARAYLDRIKTKQDNDDDFFAELL